MAAYTPALLDEIRAGVDVVELVGRFVNLRKAGQNYKGLCPFHGEKTPSFTVNPRKGIFHCFGCGVGGDVFGFLMRQDRLSFPEAVRVLARQAGVTLPDERGPRPGDTGREELFRAMELAASFYTERLWTASGERARAYLEQRGIAPEVARRFGLGWAPEGWETLPDALRSSGVTEETMLAVGLRIARENKPGAYDRFRGRLLFPIRDLQGRVVAFGGRGFGDEQPKYLNSPETPLYTKGNVLYAADLARETIRAKNRALIVEGYVDCLMAHQHGFTETVAALGTAFTAAQLGVLRRYCDEVITFFDADAAGQKAAERAEELLEPTGSGMVWGVNRSGSFEASGALRVKVALLPAGHDPDTFLRTEGAAAFDERITAARSLLAYALDRAVGESTAAGARGRVNAFAKVALMLAKVGDAQEATALAREAALKLGVDPTQLWIEAQRLQVALRKPPAIAGKATTTQAPAVVERDLVGLLLISLGARDVLLPLLELSEIAHAGLREIVETLGRAPAVAAEQLMSELDSDAARHTLSALLVEERPLAEEQTVIEQFRRRLERARTVGRLRTASQAVAAGQQAASSAVPMDPILVAELQHQGAALHELVGGAPQSLNMPAVESRPDPSGSQGVHAHE
ncbi:MAG TPA: DNA primase [Methylomirabilota bacterium]|jgi:DNA primase|nr:DNA primase [Methylomirabilota bacterium]